MISNIRCSFFVKIIKTDNPLARMNKKKKTENTDYQDEKCKRDLKAMKMMNNNTNFLRSL